MALLNANFGSRAWCSVEVDDVIYVSSAHPLRQKFAHVNVNTEPDLTGTLTFWVGDGGAAFERFTSWEVPVSHDFDWTSTPFPASFVDAVADWIDGSDSYEMNIWVALTTVSATYDDRVRVKARIGEAPETAPSFELSAVPFGAGADYALLQNLTQIKAEVTGAKVGKGSVESVVVKCLGWRSDSPVLVTPAVYKSGTVEVEATVTSSLNVSTVKTAALTCTPYERPAISSAAVYRCLEDGTAKDDAAWARAEAAWSYHPLAGDNSCSAQVSYREVGSDTWSEPVPLRPGEPTVFAGDLDMTVSYEALFSVSDRFATAQGILDIAIPYFTIDMLKGGRGIAFGTAADSEGFKVGMAARFLEALEAAKDLAVSGLATLGSLVVKGKSTVGDVALASNVNQITRPVRGTSWINGRSGAVLRVPDSGSTSFDAVLSSKTPAASWELGTIGERLAFSRATDANYNAGTNNTGVLYAEALPAGTSMSLGGFVSANGYWGMRTPENTDNWIRTTTQGLIPASANSTSGASALGTSGWPFATAYVKTLHAPALADVTTINGTAIATYIRNQVPGYVVMGWTIVTLTSGTLAAGAAGSNLSTTWTCPSGTTTVSCAIIALSMCASWNSTAASLSGTTVTISATPRRAYGAGSGTVSARFLVFALGPS